MSQYFALVNPTKEEFVSPPGLAGAVERITNPNAMGILGFLLLEGPNDGTSLGKTADTDTDMVRKQVEEIKEQEEEIEEKNFNRYLEERPDYAESIFERETGQTPDEAPDEYREFSRERTRSTYRNDDGSWDTDNLIRIALSHLEIKETHEYAGRWAGCSVALTGDYSERDWYDKCRTHTVARLPNDEEVRLTGVRELVNPDGSKAYSTPISTDEIPYADEPGDLLEVRPRHHDGDDDVVGEVVRIEPPEFTDITDGVVDEFKRQVGEDWWEEGKNAGQMRPSFVVTSD